MSYISSLPTAVDACRFFGCQQQWCIEERDDKNRLRFSRSNNNLVNILLLRVYVLSSEKKKNVHMNYESMSAGMLGMVKWIESGWMAFATCVNAYHRCAYGLHTRASTIPTLLHSCWLPSDEMKKSVCIRSFRFKQFMWVRLYTELSMSNDVYYVYVIVPFTTCVCVCVTSRAST